MEPAGNIFEIFESFAECVLGQEHGQATTLERELVGNSVPTGRMSVAWAAPGPVCFVGMANSSKIPQLVLELISLAPIHAGSAFELPNKKTPTNKCAGREKLCILVKTQ